MAKIVAFCSAKNILKALKPCINSAILNVAVNARFFLVNYTVNLN